MSKKFKYILNHANLWRDFILDLVFPLECLGCGTEGSWLCVKCEKKLLLNHKQYCLHCKKLNTYGKFCSKCKKLYTLDGVFIAGDYENKLIADLIKNLKYHFAKDISKILGSYLAHFLINITQKNNISSKNLSNNNIWQKIKNSEVSPHFFYDIKNTIIIPVPLHIKRLNWRGFNQAEEIANVLADKLRIKINNKDLLRSVHKKPQAKLNEQNRKKNIINCYEWQGSNLKNKNIILLDDVVTTGSTLNECAKVLKKNGAKEVWGLVVAKG